ncbi:hypothetical protein [Moorena sp. SIO3H5]|uniref:hypothetical protein n=1 Tax=Moorena sp. SIO3H5 TaxID=2607834 RepID=UPI0013BB9F7B|nr:hypothetical protein [Moorena sp. SIO3H5]NEO74196.1 hypothetical protein [Moorena sp. SIO3H5]
MGVAFVSKLEILPISRFPIPDSRFPIPDSRFSPSPHLPISPSPDSRFPIPDSRIKHLLIVT